MTHARYHELLSQLLDGSLTEADAAELREELERDPDHFRDVREHLILADLLGQAHAPDRAAEPFWQSVQARLDATLDPAAKQAPSPGPVVPPPARRKYGRLVAGIAAGLLMVVAIASQWLASSRDRGLQPVAPSHVLGPGRAGVMQVSLRGEVVCRHCTLHQTQECHPVVRVREGGHEQTLYLDDNAVCRDFARKQGCGRTPLPVLAEGTVHTENGRPHFGATRLEVRR